MQLQIILQHNNRNNVFSWKQTTRYRLTYLEISKIEKRYAWRFEVQTIPSKINGTLYSQVKKQENGTEDIFRDKQTPNKVPLMFLDIKVLTHM